MTSTKPFHKGSPFNILFDDPVRRHLLDIFLTNDTIPVTIEGCEEFTGDDLDDIEDALELFLDIDIIERSDDGELYCLAQTDDVQHLEQYHTALHDHVNRLHETTD